MSINDELNKMLAEAQRQRTWGEITVSLQDGKAVVIKQTVTRKLYDESRDNRDVRTLRF